MDDNFLTALGFTLRWEGGYSYNSADPGGATMKGIIQTVYDSWRQIHGLPVQDVKNISDDEVNEIYFNNYWKGGYCNLMSAKLATAHFDACVNCGCGQAAKFLQSALSVTVDGGIGPETLTALTNANQDDIAGQVIILREGFYRGLVQEKPVLGQFLEGWLARAENLKTFIAGLS